MQKELVRWQMLFGQFDQVLVVSEEDHLSLVGNPDQLLERLNRSVVIEMDQNVIEHQRHRLVKCVPLLKACQTKRQKQLIARPIAHLFDRDLGAWSILIPLADQKMLSILIERDLNPTKTTQRHLAKRLARQLQYRILVGRSIPLDTRRKRCRGQP